MNFKTQKITINIDNDKYRHWKSYLKKKLEKIKSNNLEINCNSLILSCKDLLEIIEIANQFNCKINSFCSTSSKTIVSSQSLGYSSKFNFEHSPSETLNINNENLNSSKPLFHQGTVRSGDYINSTGDLVIIGDVNPGAIVSAQENIIIWGRLLGIAHAGSEGNSRATISALQLRPVQLRIAHLVARGPQEKHPVGLVEQAKIDSERIVIAPLESI
tara:strand:+ start:580 stop:1227 length:648 start_codon:yes stop_codon:yes gene_type:complete